MNSRPCSQCVDLMNKVGIKTVYYSSENSSIVKKNVSNMETYTTFGNRYLQYVLHPARCTDPDILVNEANKRRNAENRKRSQSPPKK